MLENLRSDDRALQEVGQLLIAAQKPHQAVTKPTIARWIKTILGESGIDIMTFKAHSTRAASTSKAEALGLSIEDIITQGNWSNRSTFERFYKKPIESAHKDFQNKVLGSLGN